MTSLGAKISDSIQNSLSSATDKVKDIVSIDPVSNSTHADGLVFACLILLVLIILISIGLMTEWSKISQNVAAVNQTASGVQSDLSEQCRTEYSSRRTTLQALTGVVITLSLIELIIAFIFLRKSQKSVVKFTGKGYTLFIVSLTVFISLIIPGIMLAFKPVSICNQPSLSKVAYNSTSAAVIVSCFGVLITGFVLKSDTVVSVMKPLMKSVSSTVGNAADKL